ncbi:MAG: molybdopterin-dependent oxidoreductase, partial [Xanthomonadaceae bacterium]|nr:molybdopterin-dependent oxidoreductase [Xanthomonadaceae bacterium]
GDDLGVLAHPATSNEEGALLARLADALGTGNLDHRIAQHDLSDGAVAAPFALSVAEIEQAGTIVIVGSNLRHEVPLLHQRVHKAAKRGAAVHVVNPVDFDVTFKAASNTLVPPSQMAAALAALAVNENAKRPGVVVIVGAVAENSIHASAIRKAASAFASANGAALCRIPQGANALGLAQMGVLPTARDAQAMLADPRKAYVVYGLEPGLDFADQARALKALGAAKVVAFSQFACRSTRAVADVILPIAALPEIDATLTNLDGFDQHTSAGGKSPGDARPGWRVLRALGAQLDAAGFDFNDLAGLRASLAPRKVAVAASAAQPQTGEGIELAISPAIYRVDATTRRAAALQAHPLNAGPRIVLHSADAAVASLASGAMAKVDNGLGTATLQVVVDDRVARGAAWVESGYGPTAALGGGRVRVAGVA